jgi:hypothetical protein
MKVLAYREKGSEMWIGHHAREWLLADPRRITDVQTAHGFSGTRPYEKDEQDKVDQDASGETDSDRNRHE